MGRNADALGEFVMGAQTRCHDSRSERLSRSYFCGERRNIRSTLKDGLACHTGVCSSRRRATNGAIRLPMPRPRPELGVQGAVTSENRPCGSVPTASRSSWHVSPKVSLPPVGAIDARTEVFLTNSITEEVRGIGRFAAALMPTVGIAMDMA